MYQYIFDETTTKDIKNNTANSKNILEQFADVDNKYTFGNPVDIGLNLQKDNYVAPSQEEVKNKAKNSLESYKNEKIGQINDNFDEKSQKIDANIDKSKQAFQDSKQEIVGQYANVKQKAKDDAITRGLARSSIIVNTLANYDNNMLNELSVLASKTNDELANLDTQKNTLELEKSNALNDFNIEYAIRLQAKIDSLNEEIAKAEQSAMKYNNEIAQLEAKWASEQEEKNHERQTDLLEFVSKYGSYAIDLAKQNEKYSIAREHFANMDKDRALIELNNNSAYKENLGATNYRKLIEEISAR